MEIIRYDNISNEFVIANLLLLLVAEQANPQTVHNICKSGLHTGFFFFETRDTTSLFWQEVHMYGCMMRIATDGPNL